MFLFNLTSHVHIKDKEKQQEQAPLAVSVPTANNQESASPKSADWLKNHEILKIINVGLFYLSLSLGFTFQAFLCIPDG